MFYEDIFREFGKKKIRYLVVGGLAVNLHGIPRMTQDLDLLVGMDESNILSIIKSLKALGYKPRLPVNPEDLANEEIRDKWVKEKNIKVFTFFHSKESVQEVDILLVSPLDFKEAYKHKVVKKAAGMSISLVAIKDLIKMKKELERKTDLYDVKMLETLLRMGEK